MEKWDVYTRDRKSLNKQHIRGHKLNDNEYHLVVSAIIRHIDGDFLLMQRSFEKKPHPGIFEASCGGSVLAGETTLEAIKREAYEETGVRGLSYQLINQEISDQGHSLFDIFLIETDIPKDAIVLQEGETIAYKWVSPKGLLAFFDSGEAILNQQKRLGNYLIKLKETTK